YATALFDAETIERFAGYYRRVLEGMVADATQRVDRLALLDEAELEQQLVSWNRSERQYPLEQSYTQLFERQVSLDPSRLAVVCGEQRLSYGELYARSTRLAAALRRAGAGRDTLVTLVSERDEVLLTMMLAVLQAGAAFLPLDIKHPSQRLREIVQMSGSVLLLVSEGCREQAAALAGEMACVVAQQQWAEGAEGQVLPTVAIDFRPSDLAYVIFTSGSTGKPKGAMVEQLGMLNHMFGKLETMAVGASDRLAQTASPAFDICVWQFLSALVVGGCTVILRDEIAYDPQGLVHAVEREGITLLQTVPSMMRAMLNALDEGESAPPLASLRWLIPTGEALSTKLACDWFDRYAGIPLMNVYGPAECSDDVTYQAFTEKPAPDSLIAIGRPTPNNKIYILDRQGQPVPVGVKGEICVGGLGVGRGYLNNPQQTEAAFVAHPWGGGRFYRTGDLGSYRRDGTIDFHGRLDFQVKIRGFRIELGEIEARLAQCEGVQEAVVLARAQDGQEARLVAYVVAPTELDIAKLRAELGRGLPEYMVPAAFVRLEAFPLTPNGKLDRKALPEPDVSAVAARAYEAPQGEVEQTLAAIWGELLKLQRIGRRDNFFELGG
ncbi:amino acid adenylation domain-containing protein, partial [Paucibacter sp. APW11]